MIGRISIIVVIVLLMRIKQITKQLQQVAAATALVAHRSPGLKEKYGKPLEDWQSNFAAQWSQVSPKWTQESEIRFVKRVSRKTAWMADREIIRSVKRVRESRES
jgi:cyclopropane fatty-acyl-phospholipid synthase-like methyltransferase